MVRRRSPRLALVPLLAAFLAAAWPGPVATAATPALVVIGDRLSPATLEVAPGTTVTWRNDSGNRHRVRTISGPVRIDSGNLEPGGSYSVTLTAIGSYAYVDARDEDDPAFHGTIVVTDRPSTPLAPGATPAPVRPEVRMAGRTFRPASLTVEAGTAVRFVNDDDRDHTATGTGGSFDSGLMRPGAAWSRTFASPDTFAYLCALHPDMRGTITVRATAGAPVEPVPAPDPAPATTPTPTDAAGPGGGGGGSVVLELRDIAFAPDAIRVTAGDAVTWVNAGVAPHTVTDAAGSFDSGWITSGERWSHTFGTPGSYALLCLIHPEMTATLEVVAAAIPGGEEPPGATEPPVAPALGEEPVAGTGVGAGGSGAMPAGPGASPDPGRGGTDAIAAGGAASGSVARTILALALVAAAVGAFGLVVRGTAARA